MVYEIDGVSVKVSFFKIKDTYYSPISKEFVGNTEETKVSLETKKRLFALQNNLNKAGSMQNLLDLGGEKTRRYLDKTRKYVQRYLCEKVMGDFCITPDDVFDGVKIIKCLDIDQIINTGDIKALDVLAETGRQLFVDRFINKLNARNPQKEVVPA